MKDYKKELMEYCENTMKNGFAGPTTERNWAFGAIDFAYGVGLIDKEAFEELLNKYKLV